MHRLKDACVVEEFEAKVDGKVCLKNLSLRTALSCCVQKSLSFVHHFFSFCFWQVECCLRLLQEFSPNNFEPKTRGCGEDCDNKVPVKFGKMIQQNDQLVELSLDQQIYDLIDAAGSKGVTFREVGIGSFTCLIDSGGNFVGKKCTFLLQYFIYGFLLTNH